MLDNNERPFLDVEESVNEAFARMGKDVKIDENQKDEKDLNIEEKVELLRVQEMLEELKTDEFEKLYINSASQINTPNMEGAAEGKTKEIQNVAEYQLSQMNPDDKLGEMDQQKLKSAANFYMIPRSAEHKVSVGNQTQTTVVDFYTITDPEGCSIYNVIDEKNITLSSNMRLSIKKYLEKNYPVQLAAGIITVNQVVEKYTPQDMNELFDIVGDDHPFTARFLETRIDEIAEDKGIDVKMMGAKAPRAIDRDRAENRDNLSEETQVEVQADPADELAEEEKETLDEPDGKGALVDEGRGIKLDLDEEEPKQKDETLVEKIARYNHVKPAVVNTRVIENFEKVEEDTGIPLKGRYPRGEVIAVRIPHKLGYRTFLVEKSTGMTIDGKGVLDHRGGKYYNFSEMQDYFRFKLRDGEDGGDNGKPLEEDEGRDYITYINEHGEVGEEKFINNGKEQDMLREERQRYLTEVEEVDRMLKDAIEAYQDKATQENYEKVRELINKKIEIDDKYNALDEQREMTEKTIENTEDTIGRDLDDDDDDWFPGPGGRSHW